MDPCCICHHSALDSHRKCSYRPTCSNNKSASSAQEGAELVSEVLVELALELVMSEQELVVLVVGTE